MCLVATWPPARPCVTEFGDRGVNSAVVLSNWWLGTSDSKRIPNKVHSQNTAGKQMRSTVAFAGSVYHGPCQSAKHAPEFERGALFCLDISPSRFLIGMPVPHAMHVCRARTLERLPWGRRSAPRKALRRGLNRRPASSNPLQNSNASLFLSARTRTREVLSLIHISEPTRPY